MADFAQINKASSNTAALDVAKGSAIVLCGMVLGYGGNFVYRIILARSFTPADFGLISMAMAALAIVSNISTLGLNSGIARFVALHRFRLTKKRLISLIRSGAALSLLSGIVLCLLALLIVPWLSEKLANGQEELTFLFYGFIAVSPVAVMSNYALGVLRGFKDMKAMLIANDVVNWLTRIIVLVVVLVIWRNLFFMPLVAGAAFTSILATSVYFISRNLLTIKTSDSGEGQVEELVRKLIAFSLPLSFAAITGMLRKRLDILLVGFFLVPEQVGFYSAAVPFAALMTVFLFGINRVVLPVASELYGSDDHASMKMLYQMVARWSLFFSFPVFCFVFFAPELLLTTFFGAAYEAGANALRILAVGSFVNMASGSFGEFLQTTGKTWYVLAVSVVGVVTNLISMLILVPHFGISGGASAMTLSMIFMCITGVIFLYREKQLHPFSREYIRTASFSVVFFLLIVFCQFRFDTFQSIGVLIPVVGIAGSLYVVGVYFSGGLSDSDLAIIGRVKLKIAGMMYRK